MASMYPDEGVDKLMGVVPKNGTNIATLYIGLFTSQTPSTVPARTATGGASPSGWTEVSGTSYARQSIAAASWGSPSTSGSGRKISAAQVTFPTAGAGGWTAANGFFVATNSASGSGDTVLYFCNFDDATAVTLLSGDVIQVTPSMLWNGS